MSDLPTPEGATAVGRSGSRNDVGALFQSQGVASAHGATGDLYIQDRSPSSRIGWLGVHAIS